MKLKKKKQKQTNQKTPNECIYSIFIWLYTVQQSDWRFGVGLGRGQWGWTQSQVSIGWADPIRLPQRKAQAVGGEGVEDARQKAGRVLYTSKAYISSEQNHSLYFMQKIEVECTLQKPRLVPRRGSWKSSVPGGYQALAEAMGVAATWPVFPRNAQYLSFV